MASVAAWFATIVRLSVDKSNMMSLLAVIAKASKFFNCSDETAFICKNVDMRNI
jgi:hypothetical protein